MKTAMTSESRLTSFTRRVRRPESADLGARLQQNTCRRQRNIRPRPLRGSLLTCGAVQTPASCASGCARSSVRLADDLCSLGVLITYFQCANGP